MAIFGLAKDIIVKEPVKEILSHKYLKEINSEKLFDFDTELDKVISALTFGVPLEMADEVLIFKGIKILFLEETMILHYFHSIEHLNLIFTRHITKLILEKKLIVFQRFSIL